MQFKGGFVFLDGAMGTVLQSRGVATGCAELLNLTRPELIEDIHRSYVESGSDIIYANTFGANARKLRKTGKTVAEVVAAGVKCAQNACKGDTLVALDIGPLGELLEPMGELSFDEAVELFKELAIAGESAGADLAVIETMTDLNELRAAILAVKENTRLPFFATMSFQSSGRTYTGCAPEAMAVVLESLGASAIGVNCSLAPGELYETVKAIAAHSTLPLLVKANAGRPRADGSYALGPEDYAQQLLPYAELGVRYIGGCCGTSPEYIRAIRAAFADRLPRSPERRSGPMLATAKRAVSLEGVSIVGERINSTGPKVSAALREGDLDYIVEQAQLQLDAGAAVLDVNVWLQGRDEAELMGDVVGELQTYLDAPLQFDSISPEALETGLRAFCGRGVVNSVTGKREQLERVLPLVKKYGAMVVGMTIDEGGIPETAEGRVEIARRIVAEAERVGIAREDVLIDCLALAAVSGADAQVTLDALRQVKAELGVKTTLGISNVSYGLPERDELNRDFLLLALSAGLDMPIMETKLPVRRAVAAYRALRGDAGAYLMRK